MSVFEVGLLLALAAAASVEGRTARSAGVPISFHVVGKGDPALVLVHGWAFDRHLWDGEVSRIAARHRVVTLDLAGHGASGKQRAQWTMGAFGGDVKAVVAAVGAKQVVLVGHSMGGPVVLEAARRMPDRVKGVVLIDTLLDVEEHMPAEQVEALTGQLEADYKTMVTRMSNEYLLVPGTPPAVREQVLGHVTAMAPKVSAAVLREAWSYDPLPALGEIKAPIRAVNADKFPTNLEANRRHMPGYEAIFITGVGHYPMLEDPTRFGRALDESLAKVLAAQPRR